MSDKRRVEVYEAFLDTLIEIDDGFPNLAGNNKDNVSLYFHAESTVWASVAVLARKAFKDAEKAARDE